ncbi:MAG: LamG domain-containing protein [bacterium]
MNHISCLGFVFVSIATCVMMQGCVSINNHDERLIAEYTFNDGTACDSSGGGNHGIVHNAKPAQDRRARPNRAMSFNGQNAWIEIPSSPVYDALSEITIAFWLCPQKGPNGEHVAGSLITKQPSGYLSKSHNAYSSNHGGLFDLSLCLHEDALKLYFCSQVSPAMCSEGHIANMASLTYGTWHHIVITATRDKNRVCFYVDGKKVDDLVYTQHTHVGPILSQPNQEPIRIGKRKDADFIPSLHFLGSIDDIRIYNRALSDQDIQQVYEAR